MFDKINFNSDDLVHYENERCTTGETQTQKCRSLLTLCDTCNDNK